MHSFRRIKLFVEFLIEIKWNDNFNQSDLLFSRFDKILWRGYFYFETIMRVLKWYY